MNEQVNMARMEDKKPPRSLLLIVKFLGFVIGCVSSFLLEVFILMGIEKFFDVRVIGFGFIILPIFVGILCSRLSIIYLPKIVKYWKHNKGIRVITFISLLWITSVGLFVFLKKPYGTWMHNDDYSNMIQVMLLPSIILFIFYLIYDKFIK